MNRDQLNEATKLVANIDSLILRRGEMVDARSFQIETPHGAIHVDKYETGALGRFYNDVNQALISLYDGDIAVAAARLRELGVEIVTPAEAAATAPEAKEGPAYVQDGGSDV